MPAASQTPSRLPKRRSYRMRARAHATAATRERLLEAAWHEFATRPFEEARLADIARAARVSAPTLHAHFGTKDELFVAAWRWRMDPETARRASAEPGDVAAAVTVLYDSYEEDADPVLRLFAQEDRIPAVHDMLEDGRRRHRRWVERTLGALVGDATDRERERRLVALVVATDLLVWKLLRREMALDRAEAERIVAEMVARVGETP
jgi:AcrR family transcriptional regulator